MLTDDDLRWKDGLALAQLVADKEVSPRELVEHALRRIEAYNPTLNAVVRTLSDAALEAADGPLPDGPFRGVPFLLKDLKATLAGVPITCGSAFTRDLVPPYDAELVKRYRQAGLIFVGKTNTPEFGILPTTEPRAYGKTRNPWNTDHITGGSSGGAAAAVAAGIVPMAHGGDGGGSIRIPASCCGLFGLKPTRARNPLGPDLGDALSGLVCEHAITRTVRDSAALLDASSGPDIGDPYWAPPPARPFLQEVGADPGKLRIAFTTVAPTGVPIHADCVAAVEAAAKACEQLGHHVEEASPPIDGNGMSEHFMVLWCSGTAANVAGLTRVMGRAPKPDELEPLTWKLAEMGRNHNGGDYLLALQALQQMSRIIGHFMQQYDIWLTPTLAEPPLPLGQFDTPDDNPLMALARASMYVPFTPLCNVTGQPAMSLPLHWNDAGLPVGTHFVGRFGDEATLLRLASQLEQAHPWSGRRPPAIGAAAV